jgi:hypothetical protein
LVKVHSQKPGWGRDKEVVEEDLPPEEFLSKEVDPILDKILETARAKMRKR